MRNNILYYQFSENYWEWEEFTTWEEKQIKYWHTSDGEIHGIIPEIEVVGEWLKSQFESYVNDPEINSWIEKVLNSLVKKTLYENFKNFETMNISNELHSILEKYPNLLLEISWTLWLPISEKRFSNLSTVQKIKFYELYEAIHSSNYQTANSIIKKIESIDRNIEVKLFEEFAKQYAKGLDNFKDTFKNFWLTEWETKRVAEYFSFLDRHPELWWNKNSLWDLRNEIIRNNSHELMAGGAIASRVKLPWWWYLIVWAWLFFGWMYAYSWREDYTKIQPETINWDGWTEIKDPIGVMEFIWVEIPFQKAWTDTIVPFDVDTTKLKFDKSKRKDWKQYYERGKNNAKNLANKPETKIIKMVIEWVAQWVFNLEKCRMFYNKKTWELKLQLPEPELEPKNVEISEVQEDREFIHLKEMDNWQENLRQRLTKEVIDSIENNDEFYTTCKLIAAEQLNSHIKSISNALWVEIKTINVTIKWSDEISTPLDN